MKELNKELSKDLRDSQQQVPSHALCVKFEPIFQMLLLKEELAGSASGSASDSNTGARVCDWLLLYSRVLDPVAFRDAEMAMRSSFRSSRK